MEYFVHVYLYKPKYVACRGLFGGLMPSRANITDTPATIAMGVSRLCSMITECTLPVSRYQGEVYCC
jgi:hypothetical protein